MTRLGEISPLGQTIKNLWQIFEGLFSVWQHFEPTLWNQLDILGKFEVSKEAKSGHTGSNWHNKVNMVDCVVFTALETSYLLEVAGSIHTVYYFNYLLIRHNYLKGPNWNKISGKPSNKNKF